MMRFLTKLFLVATFFVTNAYAEGFTASVGTDYSTGKYGTSSSTDVWYVPFAASYNTGAFTYKLTVPWIQVTGNGSVVPSGSGGSVSDGSGPVDCRKNGTGSCTNVSGGGGGGGGSTTTGRTTESGLGDVVAAATYNAFDGGDQGFVVDFTGRIKFGTASDSRGLGSGETDYSIQTNIDKNFGPMYASFGLGYKVLGEPSGVNYKNLVYGSLGGGYKLNKDAELGVSYDLATSSVSGGAKPQEVSLYGSYYINNNYKLDAVVYGGLTDASPDVGGGLTLKYFF
jgi:hypothetical protein